MARVTSDVTAIKTVGVIEDTVLAVARLCPNAVSHHSEREHVNAGQRGVEEFPAELLRFFTQRRGQVLLVRGDPGAGKTLFAVQALDILRQYGGDVLYVTTRVDTDTIYRNYLKETTRLTPSNVLDISQDPFDADITPAEEIGADRFDPDTFLEWLRAVSDVSDPFTAVFDSWELVEQHLLSEAHQDDAPEPEELVTRMAKLARRHGFRIILITEEAGIEDLDTMLDGGYNRGSVVHFELGPDLSRDAWSLPCLATAQNFLSHGLGVAVVPLPESSPGLVRRNLGPALPDSEFQARCDVFETYDHKSMTPVSDVDDDPTDADGDGPRDDAGGFEYDDYIRRLESLREESDGPLLHTISMDAAGDALSEIMSDHATYVALHNDLSVLVTKPGSKERTRADRVADVHLRLERRGETVFMYGKNPVTPFLGFDTSVTDGTLDIALQEMV